MANMAESAVPVRLDRAAIGRGALVGAIFMLTASFADLSIGALTEGDGDGHRPVLFIVIIIGYFAAGRAATRRAERDPFRHGSLAALMSFGIWLALRLFVAVVTRDGLADGALQGVFGHVVTATAFGMLGGLFGLRELKRRELERRGQSEGPPSIH